MKTLYLDCSMGAAGDMLSAALFELLPEDERGQFIAELNSLGIPGVSVSCEPSVKCGITGTHFTVSVGGEEESPDMHEQPHHDHNHDHDHHHHHHEHHDHPGHHHEHRSVADIQQIVEGLPLKDSVKRDILGVYSLIAEAESHAHGAPVSDIHFHEVGTLDAITDVTAACMLFDRLSPDFVTASPVRVGSGQVRCAHGILPVPAPATAYILRDVPIYAGDIESEMCTPTGAALLQHFVQAYQDMPVMRVSSIGYGMGKKDFPTANCVRAMLGETENRDTVVSELRCNLDDMTPEAIGYAMDHLLSRGALDVYSVPIQMKKSRPGVMLCVLCRPDDRDDMAELIFKYTTTLGIREQTYKRYTLTRTTERVETELGTVRVKRAHGYGVSREKYEYDDLADIAYSLGSGIDEARAYVDRFRRPE